MRNFLEYAPPGSPARVLAQTWIPLEACALCLDCEALYPLAYPACPRCASTARAAVERWLVERQAVTS